MDDSSLKQTLAQALPKYLNVAKLMRRIIENKDLDTFRAFFQVIPQDTTATSRTFIYAANQGSFQICQYLLSQHKAQLNKKALRTFNDMVTNALDSDASLHEIMALVNFALENGGNVDAIFYRALKDRNFTLALHCLNYGIKFSSYAHHILPLAYRRKEVQDFLVEHKLLTPEHFTEIGAYQAISAAAINVVTIDNALKQLPATAANRVLRFATHESNPDRWNGKFIECLVQHTPETDQPTLFASLLERSSWRLTKVPVDAQKALSDIIINSKHTDRIVELTRQHSLLQFIEYAPQIHDKLIPHMIKPKNIIDHYYYFASNKVQPAFTTFLKKYVETHKSTPIWTEISLAGFKSHFNLT